MNAVMVQPFKLGLNLRIAAQGRNAFSLVELAVVLAIIGLIAGGVMGTSAYLNNARKTTLINEGKYYLNALKSFQTKYGGALPGDIGNATDYWTGAFNGDGNGVISPTGGNGNESFPAFQHMKLAGLINGKYSGTASGPYATVIGSNAPILSMEGVTGMFFTPFADGITPGTAAFYSGTYGHVFFLTKETGAPSGGFLKPIEAYELDNKFDDGQADKGWIRTFRNGTSCVGGGTTYLTATTADACALMLSM